VALLWIRLVKYYGIKENDAHTTENGNNLFKIIGGFISGGLQGLNGDMKTKILECNETLCPFFSKNKCNY
jgi:hypothetical protein